MSNKFEIKNSEFEGALNKAGPGEINVLLRSIENRLAQGQGVQINDADELTPLFSVDGTFDFYRVVRYVNENRKKLGFQISGFGEQEL